MSVLTLVRHGQASIFSDDYDRLSAVGERQAMLLGQYWARRQLRVDAVYSGPRARQRRTAELVGAEYRQAGLVWPEPVVLVELDEYDLDGLFGRLAPRLAERDPAFAQLAERLAVADGELDRLRSFQRLFEALLTHWQTAAADDGVEGWPAFRARVQGVLRRMQAHEQRGRRTVLFTSGGFIGSAAQCALAAPDRAALELNWRVRNGSLTEFVCTPQRLTLDSFNAVPHLADPELWTFR